MQGWYMSYFSPFFSTTIAVLQINRGGVVFYCCCIVYVWTLYSVCVYGTGHCRERRKTGLFGVWPQSVLKCPHFSLHKPHLGNEHSIMKLIIVWYEKKKKATWEIILICSSLLFYLESSLTSLNKVLGSQAWDEIGRVDKWCLFHARKIRTSLSLDKNPLHSDSDKNLVFVSS